jgi:hypothetical protein
MIRAMIAASVVVTLAVSTPALAQGNSQKQKKKKPAPPSRNELTAAPMATSSVVSAGGC